MPGKPKVAAPNVIAFAEKAKLDLGTVSGTGANGTITYDDAVSAHWERLRPTLAEGCGLAATASWTEIKAAVDSRLRPRALAVGLPADAPISDIRAAEQAMDAERARLAAAAIAPSSSRSVNASRVAAKGPKYQLNPLGDKAHAALAQAKVQPTSAAPTLFAAGDLPPFTASGIPVDQLLDVPWQARHALAAAPTQAEAYTIHQRCTAGDALSSGEELADDYSLHPGNDAYHARVAAWAKEQGEAAIDEDAWFAQWDRRGRQESK